MKPIPHNSRAEAGTAARVRAPRAAARKVLLKELLRWDTPFNSKNLRAAGALVMVKPWGLVAPRQGSRRKKADLHPMHGAGAYGTHFNIFSGFSRHRRQGHSDTQTAVRAFLFAKTAGQNCQIQILVNVADVVLRGQHTVHMAVNRQPTVPFRIGTGGIKVARSPG